MAPAPPIMSPAAAGGAAAAAAPLLEPVVAVGAGAHGHAARVVVGLVVERHGVGRVGVAKDVAAAPAVVAAREVVEGAPAGRVVADGGFVVGLCWGTWLASSTVMEKGWWERGSKVRRTFQCRRVGMPSGSSNMSRSQSPSTNFALSPRRAAAEGGPARRRG